MTNGDFQALAGYLRRWDGRRRRAELLLWLPRGLLIGLLVALAVALLGRARPLLLRYELAGVAVALTLIALAFTTLAILLHRRSLAAQAWFADRQFALRERMVAAVEIKSGQLSVPEELAARQLDDALAAAAAVDPVRQLPLASRTIDWLPATVALVALAALLWLPNPQEAALREQRAVAALADEATQTLTDLSAEIAANDSMTAEQREVLQQPLAEALSALAEPAPSREEIVAALSGAETELRRLSQEFDDTAAESLAEAAAALGESGAAADLAAALGAGQLAEASAAVGELAGKLADLTAEERTDLADRLAETAGALGATDSELAASLERAAEALTAGDTGAAQEALGEASRALGERSQAAATAGQAASAADQLGAARAEVAQSGGATAGGDSEGASGQGQGQGGASSGEGAAGDGSQEGGAGGVTAGGGHVENVFVPPAANLDGKGQDLELDTQCLGDPTSCGPIGGQSPSPLEEGAGSEVPYDQVFGDYRDAAFEALSSGDIPNRLQDLVRDYFTALEP
jgi:hypothetical protein